MSSDSVANWSSAQMSSLVTHYHASQPKTPKTIRKVAPIKGETERDHLERRLGLATSTEVRARIKRRKLNNIQSMSNN